MATYYVSNTATNGYGVGSDSNNTTQAQNKSTPWLTISGAHTNMTAGDIIIINDGTYNVGAGFTMTKYGTFQAENEGTVIILATTYAFNITLASDGTLNFTGIYFDGNDQDTVAAINLNDVAFVQTLNITNCTFHNCNYDIIILEDEVNLTITGCTFDGSIWTNILRIGQTNKMVSGLLVFNSNTINITDVVPTTSITLFAINGAASNTVSYMRIYDNTVNIVETGITTVNVFSIGSIDNVEVYNNDFDIVLNTTDGRSDTIIVYSESVADGYGSANPKIYNNNINFTGYNGHLIALGKEAVEDSTDNNGVYGGVVYNNIINSRFYGNLSLHSFFFGNCTNSIAYGNKIIGGYIGMIFKQSVNCIISGNQIINSVGQAMRIKGGTNCYFINNSVYLEDGDSFGVYNEKNVNFNTSGCVYANNNIHYTVIPVTYVQYNADASQDAVYYNNNYYIDNVAITTGNYFRIGPAAIAWTAWIVNEPTALNIQPVYNNVSNSLMLDKTCTSLIKVGKFITPNSRDYRGRRFNITPTIGAFEFTSRDPILTDRINISTDRQTAS